MSFPERRPTYSREQIHSYFDRLRLPEDQRQYSVAGRDPGDVLAYLALLQKHHLAEIPFENLSLHYSPHRQISIHPEEVYKKIIADDNGRGGYCMENNCLFGTLLLSLSFDLYPAGARVANEGRLHGWGHMVNIVKIGTTKYHVDVGFGGNGPIVPMPLVRNGTAQPHIGPASARLQWKNIPANTDPDQRLWTYEHRISADKDYELTYCFTELEFLPADYHVLNYFTSTNQNVFFTQIIVGEKKLLENGELVGSLILGNNDMKWRIQGEKTREIKFETEYDRVRAIEEHFGIKLSQAERDGIQGLPSQLKQSGA